MRQRDLVAAFVRGERDKSVAGHCGYKGNDFYNYSTCLCSIDRSEKRAAVNVRKYSCTTSRIQTYLIDELCMQGYEIEEYEGEPAYMWNMGYQGAPNLKVSDL